jgi:hypothetical protein
MFRIILIVAFALVVGSGAVVAVAQSGGSQAQTEAEEAGAPAGCATPGASPEVVEVEVDEVTPVVSLDASPGASPVALDLCATPEGDVPAA